MNAFIKAIIEILKQVFTDAKMRPEIKNIMGFIAIISSVVYYFMTKDWDGSVALAGFGTFMFGLSTIGDMAIDGKNK